jgi:hypothetical protein
MSGGWDRNARKRPFKKIPIIGTRSCVQQNLGRQLNHYMVHPRKTLCGLMRRVDFPPEEPGWDLCGSCKTTKSMMDEEQ